MPATMRITAGVVGSFALQIPFAKTDPVNVLQDGSSAALLASTQVSTIQIAVAVEIIVLLGTIVLLDHVY